MVVGELLPLNLSNSVCSLRVAEFRRIPLVILLSPGIQRGLLPFDFRDPPGSGVVGKFSTVERSGSGWEFQKNKLASVPMTSPVRTTRQPENSVEVNSSVGSLKPVGELLPVTAIVSVE
jgi:hypothetical protein